MPIRSRGSVGRGCVHGLSVIIPAHDEAHVIGRCLSSLLQQDWDRSEHGDLAIVVVANGCRDDTVAIARSFTAAMERRGFTLLVTEVAAASKPLALNVGDSLARRGLRAYLDADVELSGNALSAVARLLGGGGGVHLAAPEIFVSPPSSFISRSYANIWAQIPYVRRSLLGCGFYAVSEEGRSRWSSFPYIVSDDKFVRLHFAPEERRVAEGARFTIFMPEGLRELVHVRSRWCRGNLELIDLFPHLAERDEDRHRDLLRFLSARPRLWSYLPVFVLVYGLALLRAHSQRGIHLAHWERSAAARDMRRAELSMPARVPGPVGQG